MSSTQPNASAPTVLTPDASTAVPAAVPPPGTESCGCCDGIQAETPQALGNRPGLSAVAYRIGRWQQFRASLIAGLSSAEFTGLAALRTREGDDFTLGLIDAFACSADVLAFYQERIAGESWLRTATERLSLAELARLIGYRLRPGVAAETWLAFALETPPTPPATPPSTFRPEPGAFITGVPAALRLDAGLKVQSVPGPGELPQTFETVEPLDARPAWNALQPWLSAPRTPRRGDTQCWLQGVATQLKPGDGLLFVGSEYFAVGDTSRDSERWDFRLLTAVEPDTAAGRTRVRWARPLGSIVPHVDPAQQPQVYALRKRAALFGHNAPVWRSMANEYRAGYVAKFGGTVDGGEWPGYGVPSATASGGTVDLDSVYNEVAADVPGDVKQRSFAVLAKGDISRPTEGGTADAIRADAYVELYRLTGASEVSRAMFALSAKVTRLRLSGEHLDTTFASALRETAVYTQAQWLALAETPVNDAVAGGQVPVVASPDGLLPGRRLLIRGQAVSDGRAVVHQATLVSAAVHAQGATLTIQPLLPTALQRASVVVFANVALASHGESFTQVLGSGDASQAFQRFELKQLPLTYRTAASDTGAAAELTVRVGGIEWAERASLFGAAPGERAYTLRDDEQGRLWVQFGDGQRGARLPTREHNVQVRSRKGLGAPGNVRAETLTQLMSRPLGLKSVANPLPAEGGTDPESADEARASMPLGTRTLGRAVSLLDYEDFARAFAGIAKAQARVLSLPYGDTIAITVAGQGGALITASNPLWANLLAALKASGDPHVRVALLGHQASTFRLGLKLRRDPAYERAAVFAAVEAALRAAFGFAQRALAQPVLQSEVIAVAQAVPGVVAVDLDLLYGGTLPLAQTLPSRPTPNKRLQASRMRVGAGGAPLAAELLTLDPGPLAHLEDMP